MKFKLTLIAALSLLTCPATHCGVFSKFVTSARGAFTRPTVLSVKRFAPKASIFAGLGAVGIASYKIFKWATTEESCYISISPDGRRVAMICGNKTVIKAENGREVTITSGNRRGS